MSINKKNKPPFKSIFNEMSNEQWKDFNDRYGWGDLPTYDDYYEEPEELKTLKQNLLDFIESTEYPNPEFEKTFKKRIKEILA